MTVVAMLYPGHSAEDEYETLSTRFADAAFPVVHTWEGRTSHDVPSLLSLGAAEPLAAAAKEAVQRYSPDCIMWACTSGSFVYGDRVQAQADGIAESAGVPASSTTLAFIAALEHLRSERVRLAATYPAEVTTHLVELLSRAGVTLTTSHSHDVPSGEDAGLLTPAEVTSLITAGHERGVDAVLVPDTALHTVALVEDLEAELGTVVLTANAVTAWHGLRLAGHPARAEGLGTLFSTP